MKVLTHWAQAGTFRARHRALANGEHKQLSEAPYTFSRVEPLSGDRVVVAMGANGEVKPHRGWYLRGWPGSYATPYTGPDGQGDGWQGQPEGRSVNVLLERVSGRSPN